MPSYISFCFGLVLVSSLSQAAHFKTQESPFQFQFDDSNWELLPTRAETKAAAEVDQKMAEATLVNLQRKQADDKYRARFSVVSDSLEKFKDGKISPLVQYQKHAVDFLKSQRFQILSTENIKLGKMQLPAVEVVASQRDFGLKFKQVIFVKEDRAFLLTLATRIEKFDSTLTEVKSIFDSFDFNKN